MPNYPWHPHTTDSTSLITHIDQIIYQASDVQLTTEEEAVEARHELIQWYVDLYLTPQINDALHLAIQNSLEHTSDVDTQALADARIPSDATNDDTLRFSIAFLGDFAADSPAEGGDSPNQSDGDGGYTTDAHIHWNVFWYQIKLHRHIIRRNGGNGASRRNGSSRDVGDSCRDMQHPTFSYK